MADMERDLSTPEGVAAEVEWLRGVWRDDPEVAHGNEDDLAVHIVKMCAEGHPNAQACAVAALPLLLDEELTRWYA